MAKMIPADIAQLPPNTTSGEKSLYRIIQKHTPDDWICYVGQRIGKGKGTTPDFLLIGHELGVLVIEEKSVSIDMVKEFSTEKWKVVYDGVIVEKDHPLRQARTYVESILSSLQKVGRLKDHKGRLKFVYRHGVVLSNIRKDSLTHASLEFNTPPIETFDSDSVICSDELPTIREKKSDFVEKLLKINNKFKFTPLDDGDIESIRGAIFPTIRARLFADELLDRNQILESLTVEQEQIARGIGKNDKIPHRKLEGVAGSGKTIILKTRATDIANDNPDWKILITFFTRSLKNYIGYGLPANIDVMTIGQSFYKELKNNNIKIDSHVNWAEEFWETSLLKIKERGKSENIYDAVLLDESQDLLPVQVEYLRYILSDETNSAFFCGDFAQNIFKKKPIRWIDHGFQFKGRSSTLEAAKNFRNTRDIFEFGWSFLKIELEQQISDSQCLKAKELYENIEFKNIDGPKPFFRSFSNSDEECLWVCNEIRRLVQQEKVPLNSIAILYPNATINQSAKIEPFISNLMDKGFPTYWISKDSKNKINFDPRINQIVISTPDSAKGLEWDIVFMPSIEAYYPKERANQLRFVSATRAHHLLYPSACCPIENCYL